VPQKIRVDVLKRRTLYNPKKPNQKDDVALPDLMSDLVQR